MMEVLEPVTLARLPKNPQGPPNVNFGTSWGWRNGAKRKRHEVCAAVEGNCVNVYEAQNGQVIFSHAVPPTSIFAGPPCSLRWKEGGIVHRKTCYSTSNNGLFLHLVSTKGSENTKPLSFELAASSSPVVHLDILKDNMSTSLLVLQQDGTVTTISADLKNITSGKLMLREPDSMDIIAASVLSASQAQKSVLRARTDLLSNLGANAHVLVTVSDAPDASTLQKNVTYAAWTVPSNDYRRPTAKLDVQPLLQHNLSQIAPLLDGESSDIVTAKFDVRATSLDVTLSNGLLRFDLATAVPRPLRAVRHLLDDCDDTLALSSSHLLAAHPHSLRVVDVNYSTIQSSTLRTLKRKKSGTVHHSPVQFITYLGGINRVLARDGQSLIAINLRLGDAGGGRRLNTSTLANNIGRGVQKDSEMASSLAALEVTIGGTPKSQSLPTGWKDDLQELLTKQEIPAFEDIIIKSFNLEAAISTRRSLTSGLPDEVLDFVLERMFKLEDATAIPGAGTVLRLRFSSSRLVRGLCRMGVLRTSTVQRALRLRHQSKTITIPSDAIIKAVFAADPSLQLAQIYAEALTTPDAKEVICVLQFLIHRAQEHSSDYREQPALLLAESSETMEAEVSVSVNGRKEPASSVPSELIACLVPIMEHFGTFSTSTISSNLKAVLIKPEVYTLIGLLRMQLFHAGHTGSIPLGAIDANDLQHVSLQSAVKILSGSVDAFGPLDLISRGLDDDMVEEFVPPLLSEISMATQYIDESADLQGIIRETLRYAESQQTVSSGRKAIGGKPDQSRKMGEIVTLYAQRTEDEDINGLPGALPLSLRADDPIKTKKIRRGGGQVKERSQREMLMLQNRQKGPYSFERLVL